MALIPDQWRRLGWLSYALIALLLGSCRPSCPSTTAPLAAGHVLTPVAPDVPEQLVGQPLASTEDGGTGAASAQVARVAVTEQSEPMAPPPECKAVKTFPTVKQCKIPSVAEERDLNVRRDVLYVTLDGHALHLDIAWPKTIGPHPLVVLVHDGAWNGGSRRDFDLSFFQLAGAGYATVTVDYRLANADKKKNLYPAAIQDVRCAIRWLRTQSSSYDLDPLRIALIGAGVGGQLAALAATAGPVPAYDAICPVAGGWKNVQALVTMSAPLDLRPSAYGADDEVQWQIEEFLGSNPKESQTGARVAGDASPITHIDPTDPPTLVIHGVGEQTISVVQARRFQAILQRYCVDNALIEVTEGEHSFLQDEVSLAATCSLMSFLKTTIGP